MWTSKQDKMQRQLYSYRQLIFSFLPFSSLVSSSLLFSFLLFSSHLFSSCLVSSSLFFPSLLVSSSLLFFSFLLYFTLLYFIFCYFRFISLPRGEEPAVLQKEFLVTSTPPFVPMLSTLAVLLYRALQLLLLSLSLLLPLHTTDRFLM